MENHEFSFSYYNELNHHLEDNLVFVLCSCGFRQLGSWNTQPPNKIMQEHKLSIISKKLEISFGGPYYRTTGLGK